MDMDGLEVRVLPLVQIFKLRIMKNLLLLLLSLLTIVVMQSSSVCVGTTYLITENVTIYQGEYYNGWNAPGVYTRTLKSKTDCDSSVVTILTVKPYTYTYSYGVTPTSIKPEDKHLNELYIKYCNTLVSDTIKIVGYSTPLVKSGTNLTQSLYFDSHINYNQYRFAKYKNIPSTEKRIPVLSSGKTIQWTKISYYCLQRKSTIDDFNANYPTLPIFGPYPPTIALSDYPLYTKFLIYCNKMVKDKVYIVGYATEPLVYVTYDTDLLDNTGKVIRPKGRYLTQTRVFNSRINYNQYRFAKYNGIPSPETRVPTLPEGKVQRWIPIGYYNLQHKSTDADFAWYKTQFK